MFLIHTLLVQKNNLVFLSFLRDKGVEVLINWPKPLYHTRV